MVKQTIINHLLCLDLLNIFKILINNSKTMAWIRAKISFSIIRTALLYLRESRITTKKQCDQCHVKETDIDIETEIARVY
jgi:hypothetical protein